MTPQQAETAVVAAHLGQITLSIRAAEGGADVVADATGHRASVYGGDVSAALADSPPHMRVVEGKDGRDVKFERSPDFPSVMTPPPVMTPAKDMANARLQPL